MRAAPYVLLFLGIACSKPEAAPTPPTPSSAEQAVIVEPPNATTTAGPGFSVGPLPEFTPESQHASRDHEGASVFAYADWLTKGEFERVTQLTVRVEFVGVAAELGLNYVGGSGSNYCDDLRPEVAEIAMLDGGRWLVDAQMACRGGEDYFSATNDHVLVLVDVANKRAEIVWTGFDTGSNAMGVCVSSSVNNFVVEGQTLRITNTELTTLDRQGAREFPGAAEDCEPKPEQTREVARIDLTPPS